MVVVAAEAAAGPVAAVTHAPCPCVAAGGGLCWLLGLLGGARGLVVVRNRCGGVLVVGLDSIGVVGVGGGLTLLGLVVGILLMGGGKVGRGRE